ncbi:MAG: phosphoribosylglycinamide formyltransferase [Muribaculaceae bacterium]|nr:phosphoribosylglycinamide formyltransferase [Muribaculaceae bacterium]
MKEKTKIAVFASGNGSNFEAIAQACAQGRLEAEVVLCVCDHPGAYVTLRAKRLNITVLELKPKDFISKKEYEEEILQQLHKLNVQLICLAGYMRIIGPTLLSPYEGRILNIHPSLLPAFPGVDAIGQALNYGVKVFGVTVHFVDSTLDGGKIIAQAAIPYEGNDRGEIEEMIHAQEHALYINAINRVIGNGHC